MRYEIVQSNGSHYVMKGERIVFGPGTKAACKAWLKQFNVFNAFN